MPKLDLHGEDRVIASVLLKEFLDDNYKMGNDEVAIVHGIGAGILKKEVHRVLSEDKRVVEFGTDYFNTGCTLARMSKKIDKNNVAWYNTRHNLKGEL